MIFGSVRDNSFLSWTVTLIHTQVQLETVVNQCNTCSVWFGIECNVMYPITLRI